MEEGHFLGKKRMEEIPCFAACKSSCRCLVLIAGERGKSGQRRAPYFLTGRVLTGDGQYTASACRVLKMVDTL